MIVLPPLSAIQILLEALATSVEGASPTLAIFNQQNSESWASFKWLGLRAELSFLASKKPGRLGAPPPVILGKILKR